MSISPKRRGSIPLVAWSSKDIPEFTRRSMESCANMSSFKLNLKLNCQQGHPLAKFPSSSAKDSPSWMILSRSTLTLRDL